MPTITTEQVRALAPDAASAQAGKKLAAAKHWKSLGQDDVGLWGECQGSALYQVRVDLANLSVSCSCPSRKFPCKHGVGLLLLATADAVPTAQQPDWMATWIAKRVAKATPKPAPVIAADASPEAQAKAAASAARAAAKRIEQRQKLMTAGMVGLDLWLSDLMRNGIAGLEAKGGNFWENQAKRLVDAQAPGPASRLRQMAGIPGSGPDWPERLLAELGKLALLSQAWRRLNDLPAPLQDTTRQQMGWNLSAEEIDARGELINDRWLVLGQWVELGDNHIRTQRTWLLGERSQRPAVFLQFAANHMPFSEVYLPGSILAADLRFWPGSNPLRAKVAAQTGLAQAGFVAVGPDDANSFVSLGHLTITALLQTYADGLARDPWLERLGCLLRSMIPAQAEDGAWFVRDSAGSALPLLPHMVSQAFTADDYWNLFTISGGQPVDLMAEWDGAALRPLGVVATGGYMSLTEVRV